MCITKKGAKQTSETTALLAQGNPPRYFSMLDWRSHPLDIYTNQPCSLSLNRFRNRARIVYDSAETAVKYPLIMCLLWLHWHCKDNIQQCEHSTPIEAFTLTQCLIGGAVFLYNVTLSFLRLRHEERSIALTAAIKLASIALTTHIINDPFNNDTSPERTRMLTTRVTTLTKQFSELHPRQAKDAFTRLFSCHNMYSTAHKCSLFLVTFLNSIVTLYALKVISGVAYNRISNEKTSIDQLDTTAIVFITLISCGIAILRSKNDMISRSHDANTHQVNHDLARCLQTLTHKKINHASLKQTISERSDLFYQELSDPSFLDKIRSYNNKDLKTMRSGVRHTIITDNPTI